MACQHNWMVVAPIGTTDFECPECKMMRGKLKAKVIYHEQEHWNCNCGNDMFSITKEFVYCPECGKKQTIID